MAKLPTQMGYARCSRSADGARSDVSDPVKLLPAWQRNDPKIIKDAIEFWHRLRVLPAGVSAEQRAPELCATAYVDDELVGVSTIQVRLSPDLRCRLGYFRCLASPAHSHLKLAFRLTVYSHELLEQWSKEHPDEKVLGMISLLEHPSYDANPLGKRPVWRHGNSSFSFIGYTPDGHQVRLTWFDHARLEQA